MKENIKEIRIPQTSIDIQKQWDVFTYNLLILYYAVYLADIEHLSHQYW